MASTTLDLVARLGSGPHSRKCPSLSSSKERAVALGACRPSQLSRATTLIGALRITDKACLPLRVRRLHCVLAQANAEESNVSATANQDNPFDVSSNCVTPMYRSSPWLLEEEEKDRHKARIAFMSEGNVCRSVFAEAVFNDLLQQYGLRDHVECESRATRDYNVGEAADERAVEVAREMGVTLPEAHAARAFDYRRELPRYDLILVMDKFNAEDVLKEVTVYSTINKSTNYGALVHRLGDFSRGQVEDIDDPLYGNMGDPSELENVREVYTQIRVSCEGLVEDLLKIRDTLPEGKTVRDELRESVNEMKALDWLVPPMLQKR